MTAELIPQLERCILMKISIAEKYKSIPKGIDFEIPKFCVLTGKNGSGKSHLLEAIAGANRNLSVVQKDNFPTTNILLVGFNGLNPQINEQCEASQILGNVRNYWNQIINIQTNYRQAIDRGEIFSSVEQYLPRHGSNPVLYSVISNVLKRSGKNFEKLTENDVLAEINFNEITQDQLFFSQCALIFKAYHTRHIKNLISEFAASKPEGKHLSFLSQADFVNKYGPAPWDVVNEILNRAGLPYRVSIPEGVEYDLPYILRLVDVEKNVDISVNDLSSGEKVLMSLALAIYNSTEGGNKPDLLLLDEPDAPLHPQFSKLLIDVLTEVIIKKTGISVIITTHSPSTVAMAPEGSVFEIDRLTRIPRKVTNSHAINILTTGIEFLKVSYENRRQIFVESSNDVQYFDRLHAIFSRRHTFKFQPIFLEPHSGTSNCTDVINIVGKLRSSGSDLAFGLIDFDRVNLSNNSVYVLGDGKRYAIENYLLDPIFVILGLIKYGKKKFSDFGVQGKNTYVDAMTLTQAECQILVDSFLKDVGVCSGGIISVTWDNGFDINYSEEFLFHQGHEYEGKICQKFPELNAISKGKGDAILKIELLRVAEDFPGFLPIELMGTFNKVLMN